MGNGKAGHVKLRPVLKLRDSLPLESYRRARGGVMEREPDRNDPTIMGNDVPRTDRDHETPESHHAEEVVGEAAGGISGVLAGAAIGSIGGPIGAVIGGIAGAVGGWWAGKAIVDATESFDEHTDHYYRSRFEKDRDVGRRYEEVRPAYQLGHLARQNPDYVGRDFEEIESDLRQGWAGPAITPVGEWIDIREYAREAYTRPPADAERPLASSDEREVHLAETVDPNALGDDTAVTGYARGLTDEDVDDTRRDKPPDQR
jgi:hypothetical protein